MIEIGDLNGGNSYYEYNVSDNITLREGNWFTWMKQYSGLYILFNFNYASIIENEKKLKNLELENQNNRNQIKDLINRNSNLEYQRKQEKKELEKKMQMLRNQYKVKINQE